MSSSVAIVILNYNGVQYLERFLPSVKASTYNNKTIIVADNASTDSSLEFMQKHHPDIRVIVLDHNYGFAEGYNQALQQVSADYYILLNSDVEVDTAWIEPLITLMDNDKTIGATQPKILSYHQKNMFEYAGAAGGFIDSLGYPFARGRVFDSCETDNGQYDNTIPVFWATGAAMCVRSALYHEAGGLDGFFFAHMEEIDLCWRLQLLGYNVYCQPHSVVYHVGGGTLPKGNSRKTFLNFRNNLLMLWKNLPATEKLWTIPLRILLDALFALKSLIDGDGASFVAVLKAHVAFVKYIFSNRNNIKPITKRPLKQLPGVYHGSIVQAYFLQGKKMFSQIVKKKL